MTWLRIPKQLNEHLPAGDHEVLYVRPAAGQLQIARSKLSLGQKDKPRWDPLQEQPGVRIECANCREWYAVPRFRSTKYPAGAAATAEAA